MSANRTHMKTQLIDVDGELLHEFSVKVILSFFLVKVILSFSSSSASCWAYGDRPLYSTYASVTPPANNEDKCIMLIYAGRLRRHLWNSKTAGVGLSSAEANIHMKITCSCQY